MKRTIRLLCVLLSLVLAGCVLAACGDKGRGEYDPDNFIADTSNPQIVKEKVTIKMFVPKHSLHSSYADMRLFKEMEAITNIHVEFVEANTESYAELRATSWEDTSIDAYLFWNDLAEQTTYASLGMIQPIGEYIDQYAPNYKALMDEDPEIEKRTTLDDGKIYSFASLNTVPRDLTFKQFINHEQYAKVKRYIVIAVVVTMVPAAFMTYGIVRSSIFKTNVSRFVKDRLENNGTRIISYDVNKDSLTLRVVAVGKEISDSMIKRAERSMSDYKMAHYTLNVIQGSQSDSVMLLNNRLSSVRTTSDNYAAMLREEALKASSLQDRLNEYTRYDELAPAVAAEMRTLFPAVRDVSLSLSSTVTADTTGAVRRPIALVGIGAGARLSSAEHGKMKKWLAKRVGADNIELVTHTAGK